MIKSKFCPACDKMVKTERKQVSHILHLLLTMVTFFLWVPVWIIVTINATYHWSCTWCGRKISSDFHHGRLLNDAVARSVN